MSVFDRFRDRAIEQFKGVSDTVERTFRKTTLRGQIAQKQAAIGEAEAAIGRAVFAQVETGAVPPAGTEASIAAIRREQIALMTLRAELELLEAADRPAAGTCRACGAALEPGQRFCVRCGQPVPVAPSAPASALTCTACGATAAAGQKFCSECGRPLTPGNGAGGG